MNSKLLILILLPISMWALGIVVSGTVISEDDQMPLTGVSIQVEGTNKGMIADFDGNYANEKVDPQATLIYRFIGFETKRIGINNQATIAVVLATNPQQLDDVIVTGYTSQRRTDITGAVSVVDMDDLNEPEPNSIMALQGRFPGVRITSDGSPSGSNTQVVIRGVGTLNNTDPLFVIDGIPEVGGILQKFSSTEVMPVLSLTITTIT